MKWNCIYSLDEENTLLIGPTDGDVRFTIKDANPGPSSPSSYNWSLSVIEAVGLAEALLKSVREISDLRKNQFGFTPDPYPLVN